MNQNHSGNGGVGGHTGQRTRSSTTSGMNRPRLTESVAGLNSGEAKTVFETLIKTLKEITCRGAANYFVEWKLVNTAEIGGIPQNRPRIYIAGVQRSLVGMSDFKFDWPGNVNAPKLSVFLKPNKAPTCNPTSEFAVANLLHLWTSIKEKEKKDPAKEMYCLGIGSTEDRATYMKEQSPTLTRTRCGAGGFFLSAWKRMMTTADIQKLQGFPTSFRRGSATDRQLRMMMGNAMSIPVLARIQRMVLAAAGYISLDDVCDPVQ